MNDVILFIENFQYNSVVILSYFFISFAIMLVSSLTNGWFVNKFFSLSRFEFWNPFTYFRMFSHSLGHSDWQHFSNNFIKILLIGPMLEEKYGSINLLIMMLLTSGVIGIISTIFQEYNLRGASGIAFMMIVLTSFSNIQGEKIPLTVVLIFIFFVFDEIADLISLKKDNISHLGHITGAICGLVLGILSLKGLDFTFALKQIGIL